MRECIRLFWTIYPICVMQIASLFAYGISFILTLGIQSATASRMGRKMEWPDKAIAALPTGTFDRIAAVLVDGESRTDFFRLSVETELQRRERRLSPDRKEQGE